MRDVAVAIIGAGPYGMSLGAHLSARKISYAIFGHPMALWRENMPKGMMLKSETPASNLADPEQQYTLRRHCMEHGVPYETHITLDHFIEYGLAFQRRMLPNLVQQTVDQVTEDRKGYRLQLDNGEIVTAKRVVVAIGVRAFGFVPSFLNKLPANTYSHSSDYGPADDLAGKRVAIIGAGASAVDLAGTLNEIGASVTIVARHGVYFYKPPKDRTLWQNIRYIHTPIGNGWKTKVYADHPMVFYALPLAMRQRIVATTLGPISSWFAKERLGGVSIIENAPVEDATMSNQGVALRTSGNKSNQRFDHVVAATGYKVDLRTLPFIKSVLPKIQAVDHAPVLTREFETSLRGLYFIGPAAAMCFGPVMRFVYGATFASRRLSAHLGKLDKQLAWSSATPDRATIATAAAGDRS